MVGLLSRKDVSQAGVTEAAVRHGCHQQRDSLSYRRYILPLFPTFDTVKGLPSLAAAPASEGESYLECSSGSLGVSPSLSLLLLLSLSLLLCLSPSLSLSLSRSLFSLCWMLFSLRNPSCKGRSRAWDLAVVSGDAPISRASAAVPGAVTAAAAEVTGRLLLAKARRGDSRSRCRCRRLSGDRGTARGLGARSMVGGDVYAVAGESLGRCIGGEGGVVSGEGVMRVL